MKIRTILSSTVLLALIVFPGLVSAHSGMYAAKYVDGANIILMTHNTHEAQSGTSILYNFRVFDTTGVPLEFDSAEVAFKRGDKTTWSATIPVSNAGDIDFHYTYPKQGDYTIFIRFTDNDKEISGGEFPIPVARGPKQGILVDVATWQSGVIFLLGAGTMYTFQNRAKLRQRTSKIKLRKSAKK